MDKLKVLELFCGLGGWSKGFAELGHDCTGIDIAECGYPYRFIKADLFDWQPDQDYDIVLASPPCIDFSIAKKFAHGDQDERQGLDLVFRTFALIEEIKPKYWVIENVKGLAEFLPKPHDIVKYNKHPSGKAAYLWGNFPPLGFFETQIYYRDYTKGKHRKKPTVKNKLERGLIPIQLSRAMARGMAN